MNLFQDLQWRGIIYQQTDEEGIKETLEKGKDLFVLWSRSNSRQYAYWTFITIFNTYVVFNSMDIVRLFLVGGATG